MADAPEVESITDANAAIVQGKRNLLVQDFNMAVTVLARACELLAQKHGDTADELAEPYLLYGRALLGLAREDNGVIADNGGVASEEGQEAAEGEDEEIEDAEEAKENAKTSDKPEAAQQIHKDEAEAGSSKEPMTNGEAVASSSKENGDEEEGDDVNKEDEEEEINNLQVAWEVLELAKHIILKRGPTGWKLLAESYRLLGEVAMEGGNHHGALSDLQGALDLMKKIDNCEPRAIAEIHYQLGLAHALGNEFDSSVSQFEEAMTILKDRIKELQSSTEPSKSDDPFYTVEGEIQELEDLVPEIQEKITDMKDAKEEARKILLEGIKSSAVSNGSKAGTSGEGASSSSSSSLGGASSSSGTQKPTSDISHLVRKKRKADDEEQPAAAEVPCKKPTPEKSA